MKNKTMSAWLHSSYLTRTNQSYIEELYKDFINDPTAVDTNWKVVFNNLFTEKIKTEESSIKYSLPIEFSKEQSILSPNVESNTELDSIQEKILQLIKSFRVYGHNQANLDPLKIWKRNSIECLNLDFYKFHEHDLEKKIFPPFGIFNKNIKLINLYKILKKIYCDSIGIEYMHINDQKEIFWIQKNIESTMGEINFSIIEQKRLLQEIIVTEIIEEYLGILFPGTKRFSLEGGDILVPMLKEVIRHSSQNKIEKIILSMAHRGRLNVLVNVFNKSPKDLFQEFSDINENINFNFSGDVKYHQGFSNKIKINDQLCINMLLLPNPSHLEIVNPVAMGLTRAYIDKLNCLNKRNIILPITIHGDAAISGQGIVQETLNMSKIPAYDVGGTIRIVVNNQIGFTTSNSHYLRSSQYCTDIGKMLQIPIFHVNADDPEKAIFVIRTALNFRKTFKRDVLIDLVCYRRHGHNEVDEPSVTQPLMYQKIHQHQSVRKIYSKHLIKKGVIDKNEISNIVNEYQSFLNNEKIKFEKKLNFISLKDKDNQIKNTNFIKASSVPLSCNINDNTEQYSQIKYSCLKKLASSISILPEYLKLHPRVKKIYQARMEMAQGNKLFDWGGAEVLAYATLLDHGISIRLSGEDTARGTFFHRHAIVYDQNDGSRYIPLSNIHNKNQGIFSIWDSVLSEEGALAFEYGYSLYSNSNTLVIWEAQFGDFSNGAQIVIDQFISSGEQKWGQTSNLVILLPHGYEGQGPEHSSARLERYLQLCAENNMKICIPSTPSQIYHLLRYQVLQKIRKPLIIMSPKSLLRHPMVNTSFQELIEGNFQKVIEDQNNNLNYKNVKRVLICSGKIYYDLEKNRQKNKKYDTAIIRIEQLYPFPIEEMNKILGLYNHAENIIWCQEEPKNQGAWHYNKNYFYKIIPEKASLHFIGRPVSAAPAVGCFSLHQKQHNALLDSAFNVY